MKHKQLYILEAIIVVLILSILLYTSVPKAVNSQHRQKIAALEELMTQFQQKLNHETHSFGFIFKSMKSLHVDQHEAYYDHFNRRFIDLDYVQFNVPLRMDKLKENVESLKLPDWQNSELKLYGYISVWSSKSGEKSSSKPPYKVVVARIGKNLNDEYPPPYTIQGDVDGKWIVQKKFIPYAVTNGIDSYGEFLADNFDISAVHPTIK